MITIDQITEIIEAGKYDHYGIRSDVREMVPGQMVGNSHQLFQDPEYDDDDELVYPEGEGAYEGAYDAGELNGTCALYVSADDDMEEMIYSLKRLYGYYGGHIYLIGGNRYEEGYDEGEAVIEEAVVIAEIVND